MESIEQRLQTLGLELPVLGKYEGAFLPGVVVALYWLDPIAAAAGAALGAR